MSAPETERLRRWRLVLGGGEADGLCGGPGGGEALSLSLQDRRMDDAPALPYIAAQQGRQRKRSCPRI